MPKTGLFDEVTRLAQAVTETLDLSEVLSRVAQAATDLVAGSVARIWVAERGGLVLRGEAGTGGQPGAGEKTTLAIGEGLAGHVAATGELLVVDDVAMDTRVVNRAWMRQRRCVSAVTLPLRVRGELVGVLALMTRRRHRFRLRELRALSSFGAHAAIAIQNAALYADAQQRQRAAEALAEVGRMVSESLDLDEVGQRIVDSILTLLGAGAAVFYRWDPELDDLVAFSLAGEWGAALDHIVFPSGGGAIGLAARERRPIAMPDLLADTRVMLPPQLRARLEPAPCRAVLAVPLMRQAGIIGALAVGRPLGQTFTGAETALAQAFGSQVAIALENARLFAEQMQLVTTVGRRRTRLEALVEVSREVATLQPLPTLLERIATTCGRLLDTDSVGIRLVEGDELTVAYASGAAKDVMATHRLKLGQSLSGLVATTGRPLVVTDPVGDRRLLPEHRAAMQRLGYRALLAVPVAIADQTVGVLSIQTRRADGFSPEDIEIVSAFAAQVGIALQNTRLYDDGQRAYEQLQQTQEQLVQSQKMDAIGRLAGGVAHDFNNLLTVITGQSHLLLRELRPGHLREGLERIGITADRAADLTRQLLAFSRKQTFEPKVLQLNTVVDDLVPMLERVIGEDVELQTVLAPGLDNIKADVSQLQQVLMNLAGNARDAMADGGRLTIETAMVDLDALYARQHAEVTPGRYVMLAVSDTGIGIDRDTRHRIFEPFFTTKEPGKGTGLGLAMVYGIVKQSGGHIWLYSEPGRGTTFKIYLPAVQDDLEETPDSPLREAPCGAETILLVEDDAAVRQLVRGILEGKGYTVLEAATPAEALEIGGVKDRHIDLLLTDVIMPQMNGRVLADLLCAERPALPTLFMSGYTGNAVVHQRMLEPGRAYLQKPFTPDALAEATRRVLDHVPR
jgi:signal transduction histidine kinase